MRHCSRLRAILGKTSEPVKMPEEAEAVRCQGDPPALFTKSEVELKPYDMPVSKLIEGYLNGELWKEQKEGMEAARKKLEDELAKGPALP